MFLKELLPHSAFKDWRWNPEMAQDGRFLGRYYTPEASHKFDKIVQKLDSSTSTERAMTRTLQKIIISAVLGSAVLVSTSSNAVFTPKHHIATQLQAVHTGNVNGLDFLTIQIADKVGPASCHGNILKVNSASFDQIGKQEELESVALTAMLNEDKVIVTIPLRWNDCLDGMPTLSDLMVMK